MAPRGGRKQKAKAKRNAEIETAREAMHELERSLRRLDGVCREKLASVHVRIGSACTSRRTSLSKPFFQYAGTQKTDYLGLLL